MALIEKLRAYLLAAVNNGADRDMRAFFGVKNIMRLEPEAAIACRQFFDGMTDAGEVRQKAERAI